MHFSSSLKKNFQFRIVYNRGKSASNKYLVLYVLKNGSDQNRIGFSVSKKVGKSVVRNRVRRLIKESYRLTEEDVQKGLDLVFIARATSCDCSYDDISKSVNYLLKRLNCLSLNKKD